METNQTLAVGAVLHGGQYRIIGVLGQGGFGITYLAEDTGLGVKVAVKEFFVRDFCHREGGTTMRITSTLQEKRELVKRLREKFFKEARKLASLNHPNIVRVFAVFEENDTIYYVMDYIEGESLGAMVNRVGALPLEKALRYIHAVGEALEHIHSKGINHLDVKPANIMVRASDDTALLIDFGISKQYDSEGRPSSTGPVGLSYGFAPLEQYNEGGVKEFSPQTDVYALGATLYCLLSGKAPASAPILFAGNLPRLPQIPAPVMDAIAKAMSPARHDRQPSVRQFLNELSKPATATSGVPTKVLPRETPPPPPIVRAPESTKYQESTISAPRKNEASRRKNILVRNIVLICIFAIIASICFFKGAMNRNDEWAFIALLPFGIFYVLFLVTLRYSYKIWYDSDSNEIRCFRSRYKMVNVAGGTFDMGSNVFSNTQPVHRVTLNSYQIGESAVPQWLWVSVMGRNPSSRWRFGRSLLPVENVSYDDCKEFIGKLNRLTGQEFRLPTEAEWEFAARGGNYSRGYKYSGSDNIHDVAWYKHNSDSKPHAVKTKTSNELGLYDMSGNVWEWCADWYGEYKSSVKTEPPLYVIRGGGFKDDTDCCRVAYREGISPTRRDYDVGFRLAL